MKPQFIRCFPKDNRRLAEKGPFRDWVQADFRINESDQPMLYPAKVILFFENTTGQKKVLVHRCNNRSEQQKAHGSQNGIGRLVSSWPMEQQKNGDPELYVLPINRIKKVILVYEESNVTDRCPKVHVVLPRHLWAAKFIDWASHLETP